MELATAITKGTCFWSSEHQLVISNTLFQQDRCKTTWRHPHAKRWHLLDYILTQQHDTREVLHTRMMPSALGSTDHWLVRCNHLSLQASSKKKSPQTKKLQIHRLHDPKVKNNLQVKLEEKLHCVTAAEPKEHWTQIKTIPQETTVEDVGFLTRKHQDRFDGADKAD